MAAVELGNTLIVSSDMQKDDETRLRRTIEGKVKSIIRANHPPQCRDDTGPQFGPIYLHTCPAFISEITDENRNVEIVMPADSEEKLSPNKFKYTFIVRLINTNTIIADGSIVVTYPSY